MCIRDRLWMSKVSNRFNVQNTVWGNITNDKLTNPAILSLFDFICYLRNCILTLFGKTWKRIIDPRSLRSRCIKGAEEYFPRVDLSVPLMQRDPSDLRAWLHGEFHPGLKFQPGFCNKSFENQIVDYMEKDSARGAIQPRLKILARYSQTGLGFSCLLYTSPSPRDA